mmetsp:Transcript_47833/g.94379  ORF Transcript_47833/g.94379 Transcript_47833/m.94379 type:complete len:81 (-) Transcript_47833:855-1097(-)
MQAHLRERTRHHSFSRLVYAVTLQQSPNTSRPTKRQASFNSIPLPTRNQLTAQQRNQPIKQSSLECPEQRFVTKQSIPHI